MWTHCAKVLNETVFVNTVFPIWFMSKNVIRKLLVEACLSNRPFFLSKNIEILRNLNHDQICKGEKVKLQTITDIKLWNAWRFWYRFHSPQVKWYLISSTRNIVFELPHELPNHLRLKNLRKLGIIGNITKMVGDRA